MQYTASVCVRGGRGGERVYNDQAQRFKSVILFILLLDMEFLEIRDDIFRFVMNISSVFSSKFLLIKAEKVVFRYTVKIGYRKISIYIV